MAALEETLTPTRELLELERLRQNTTNSVEMDALEDEMRQVRERLHAELDVEPAEPVTQNRTSINGVRWLDVSHMNRTDPPPVRWRVESMIAVGTSTVVAGAGGLGKSQLALALSVGVANGHSVASMDCTVGNVAYLDNENGRDEIHRRIRCNGGVPDNRFAIAEGEGFKLQQAETVEALEREMIARSTNLLIIDSLKSSTPGVDENDNDVMSVILDRARKMTYRVNSQVPGGFSTLLLHHASKDGKTYRGASTIRDSVDILWHMGRCAGDTDAERRYLDCQKMRVAPEPGRRWVRLGSGHGLVFVDAGEPFEGAEDEIGARPAPVLSTLVPEILAILSSSRSGLNATGIAEACVPPRKGSDSSVRKALKYLLVDDQIVQHGYQYFLPENAPDA
jgi:hypothetical protein